MIEIKTNANQDKNENLIFHFLFLICQYLKRSNQIYIFNFYVKNFFVQQIIYEFKKREITLDNFTQI